MEHRHYVRKPLNLAVRLLTCEGQIYQAQLLDLSAIGMRVVTKNRLPVREKILDVLLPESDDPHDPTYRLHMFIAHKSGCELGLCLVNEDARIDRRVQRQLESGYADHRHAASY